MTKHLILILPLIIGATVKVEALAPPAAPPTGSPAGSSEKKATWHEHSTLSNKR
jgi:hypothetical protein